MMSRAACCLLLSAMACACGHAGAQQRHLVWHDEFDGSIGPDWVFETGNGGDGWGNHELEYYRRGNATVEDGALVITARREAVGGFRYTSARMKTQGRKAFRHGRIEARMQLPSFAGAWPAFWMLGADIDKAGWPASGEIDVMEHINAEDKVYGTIHWRGADGRHAQDGGNTPVRVQDWHVYAVEWDADAIRWFVDGRQYHAAKTGGRNGTDAFDKDFFVLLNFAIGGDWPGFRIDDARLPARMRVDYVRVYALDGAADDPRRDSKPRSRQGRTEQVR